MEVPFRTGTDLQIKVEFTIIMDSDRSQSFQSDIEQILQDLGLKGTVTID